MTEKVTVGLESVTFTKDCRCFKAGDTFEFRPGINLLVGDQGTGKSTILQVIKDNAGKQKYGPVSGVATIKVAGSIQTASFDFEKDNPRGKSYFDDKMDMMDQVAMMFASHGQVNNAILKGLTEKKNVLFMMDEPDTALSIRSAKKLADNLKLAVANGCQILMAVHNLVVIESVPEVLSLEHRKWMPSKDFIVSHLNPKPE